VRVRWPFEIMRVQLLKETDRSLLIVPPTMRSCKLSQDETGVDLSGWCGAAIQIGLVATMVASTEATSFRLLAG
jgi:hypothetical protein